MEANHRPKLEDVSAVAGVSKTTVSRVLNHRGYLSEKTIAKVQKAMQELDYRPNIIARQLYKQRTDLVGMIFPTVDNPFFSQLEAEMERQLYRNGYKVLIGNSQNDPAKEENYLQQLLTHQVDGLIVGTQNRGLVGYQHANLPVVAIDQVVGKNIPVVSSDNYQGGLLATQRLLDDGCRHIIHTNGPLGLDTPTQKRREAYEHLMTRNNLPAITYHLDFNISTIDKERVFRRIFEEHPEVDGIFAANDTDASTIINMASEYGKRIPEDLKIVGYDGSNVTRLLLPGLTTIQQPIDEMADLAVQLLQARINGQNVKSVVLPVTIWNGKTA
ncbi:LacI family DNA-binding transcriptional regulator [Limosilactobacillus mucosae]|uniref:LacI family DNA-binding transcriptional regulator n=1 Tax=Limosilactobacillus mucosae TaxID=97478 RepID=UPI00088A4B4D|nr:LacI family DNA-binding transcriptional regulator [Limosilactobacillus mucosae]SDN14202.1 transcriptional regulator, LacI family [Limosilactobacillus mucosae]SEK58248.1 transcriptional regulator, LacI family [Limosilactobacillus mucosae]SFK00326.1 transcriptional regulator, LacI family [Limosilactobacillus mucosae]